MKMMKMWRLILRNLLRNQRRTFLTASSVAITMFLVSSLAMVYTALGKPLAEGEKMPLLLVRRAASINTSLPASYQPRIMTVPGVVAVTKAAWFAGFWREPANSFANLGVDPDTVFEVQNGARIPPDQLEAFKRNRTAAVAGKKLVEKYGWKIGDRITLLGSYWGVKPELTLVGVFEGGPDDQFWFHWEYLNEAAGRPNLAGLYWVRIDRPENAMQVANAIDRLFRNSDAETKTESVNQFLLNLISMLGSVRHAILLIGSAVAFAILLVVANTVAMSVRERISEAAVMRSLGFRPGWIIFSFVGESILLTLAGAMLGVVGAKFLFDSLALTHIGPFAVADLRLRPETLGLCAGLSLLIALLATGWPAYRAARINLAEALRYTG
ncbi:MAG: FtsX-like permease family protein [Terriglobia bacterium]